MYEVVSNSRNHGDAYVVVAEIDGKEKYNILHFNKLLLDTWLDWIQHFPFFIDKFDGSVAVRWNGKENFYNLYTQRFVYDKPNKEWFDKVGTYNFKGSLVIKDNKCNILTFDGKILCDNWFDEIICDDKYHQVKLNGQWNFINANGKLISKTWFDSVDPFYDKGGQSQAIVCLNGKYNVLNTNGKCISTQWFDGITCIAHFTRFPVSHTKGWSSYMVRMNNCDGKDISYNHMSMNGKLLSKTWWKDVIDLQPIGYIAVLENGRKNIITTSGFFMSPDWFDRIDYEYMKNAYRLFVDYQSVKLYNENRLSKCIDFDYKQHEYVITNPKQI